MTINRLQEEAIWKKACTLFFKLTDNNTDKHLHDILRREYLNQFSPEQQLIILSYDMIIVAGKRRWINRFRGPNEVHEMIDAFRYISGLSQALTWRHKFFQQLPGWSVADSVKWVQRILLEWEYDLVGDDAELCMLE